MKLNSASPLPCGFMSLSSWLQAVPMEYKPILQQQQQQQNKQCIRFTLDSTFNFRVGVITIIIVAAKSIFLKITPSMREQIPCKSSNRIPSVAVTDFRL